jgi:hypothetical protein
MIDIEDGSRVVSNKRRSCLFARCLSALVIALSLVSLLFVKWKQEGHSQWLPFHRDEDKSGDESSQKFNNLQPLSRLDPVKDLGLMDYPRPRDSQPGDALTHENVSGDKMSGPFPTNAWYQNLLMIKNEPSEVHRAYSIPYIVDAIGPIPGLRLHPNHVGASSEVVQLYNVDQYGLTLGAAPDATSSHSADRTHRYHVEKMTNLGVTLQWVRYPGRRIFGLIIVTLILRVHLSEIFSDESQHRQRNALWHDDL